MPTALSTSASRYDAFISYSHATDGRLAPELQSGLERLGRPWYRLRALRTFRDQTNLSIHPDLWAAIESALANSAWFILLASPRAAASKWVAREVQWWLQHRDANRLLFVLTDGELTWSEASQSFDLERSSALPLALHQVFTREPLHVDVRWASGGTELGWASLRWRNALLDIAATVHGRSKDEMDGEAVRTLRRNRAWAAVAALALSTATLAAVLARQQALDEALQNDVVAQARLATSLTATRRQADALPLAVEAASRAIGSMTDVPKPVLGALRDAIESSRSFIRWDAGSQIYSVIYDASGDHVLTLQRNGQVRRWDDRGRDAGIVMTVATEEGASATPVLLSSPSGAAILARLDDPSWRAWFLDGQPLLGGRAFNAHAIDVAASSRAVYAVDKKRRLIRLGDRPEQDLVLQAKLPANARRLLVDPQERWAVVIYQDDGVDLIRLPTGRRQPLGFFCAEGSGLFAGGAHLLVAGCGRLAEVSLPKGEVRQRTHSALSLIDDMVVRDDGLFAVSHGDNDRVHLFTRNGTILFPAQLGVAQPTLAFSPKGQELATAGYGDGEVSRIDLRPRASVYPFGKEPGGTPTSLDTCTDRPEVFWVTQEGGLYSFDRLRPEVGVRTWQAGQDYIEAVHCLPEVGAVTERRDHALDAWTARGRAQRLREPNNDSPEGLAVSRAGPVVFGLTGSRIQRWMRTPDHPWQQLPDLPLPQPERGWRTMHVGDRDRTLALGSYNGDILLLDLVDGKPRFGPQRQFDSNTWTLAIDRAGMGFAAGGAGTPLAFFDWQGRRTGSLQTDRFMFVSSIAFDRGLVVVPSTAGELPLRDAEGSDVGPPIRPSSTDSITPMQFTGDGQLITADPDIGIGIHELRPQYLLAVACALLRDRRLLADSGRASTVDRALQACAPHLPKTSAR